LIVFHHPEQDRHDPREPHRFEGKLHPPAETASRAWRILAGLRSAGLSDVRAPEPIDDGVLEAVHTTRYLRFLRTAHERWRKATGGQKEAEAVPYVRPRRGDPQRPPSGVLAELGWHSFDVDPILAGTWDAARASAACALAAARVVSVGERAAYALCRPPGHHATADQFGGYCYLNNGAVAAAWFAASGRRVAVLDLDAHHGNGTQSIFWTRGDVFTVSIHGDPERHYPFFTGARDETGAAEGEGANMNLPLSSGAELGRYEDAMDEALGAIRHRGADVLIVALGVDTDAVDGVLALRGPDFWRIGAKLAAVGLPTVFVQEGGYGPGTLERDLPAVLMGFLDSA
jgi:acetoin utilization deacetylase AcuC-like enzyme